MPFRKRRVRPAPNKNLAKSLRRQETQDRPRLEALYPSVDRLTVELRFSNALGQPLDTKTLELGPKDPVDFRVPCPGPCGNGRMDLEGKVRDVISHHETTSEGRGKCAQLVAAGSSETCGHQLHCRIEVAYRD